MVDWTGQKIGNYQIVRVLGHGGFADVYLGQHTYLKTYTAIKILQVRLAENALEDFLQEARTVAHLTHSHIVRVLEFGEEGHTPYLVMNYCSNGTLRQRHPGGTRVPLPVCIQYINQVAEALQYAHDRKIIHRDVKPENLLVSDHDAILLSDFGISIISQSSRYQRHQDIGGTIAYSAPEQLQGKASAASDQYSLGILLYEWLVGELPYKGSFAEIASQHLVAPIPTIYDKVPSIPLPVEHVLQKTLAKDPLQRFQNVHAFAAALDQAAKGELASTVLQVELTDNQTNITTYTKTKPAPTITTPTIRQTPSLLTPSFNAAPHLQTRRLPHVRKSGLYIAIIILLLFALAGVSIRTFLTTSSSNVQNKATFSQTLSKNGQTVMSPTPTPSPTPAPTPTPAPKTLTVNRQLACTGDSCVYIVIQIKIQSFTVDTALDQTLMMLSLVSPQNCGSAFFAILTLQDQTGQQYEPNGQVKTFSQISLTQGQPLNLTATYLFTPAPGSTYTLSTKFFCDNQDDVYGDTQFTF